MLKYGFRLLVVMTFIFGCADETSEQTCERNSDCPLPEICSGYLALDSGVVRSGRCVIECRVATDCAEGEFCTGNVCQGADQPIPMGDSGPSRDGGLVADASRPPRDASRPTQDASRPPQDAAQPPRDASLPPPDAAPVPDMGGGVRGNARYGEPCQCGADCRTGFCLLNPYNGFAGQCTQRCENEACPGIDVCRENLAPAPRVGCEDPGTGLNEGDPVSICLPNETGVACARPEDCLIDGTCVTPPNPLPGLVDVQQTCSAICEQDVQCPIGYRCDSIPGLPRGVRACTALTEVFACPDGSNRDCGGVCPLGPGVNDVDVSHCILLDQGAAGYCSCSCATAGHCPAGFACSREVIETGDRSRPGICLPIAGYTCPLGANSCLSLACGTQRPGTLYAECTAPCTGPQDCPTGMVCLPDPELGASVCVTP